MRLEEIEQKLIEEQKNNPIRLEKFLRRRKESFFDFVVLFFTKWNFEKNTVYVSNKLIQTPLARRRSIGDLFILFRYYYPDLKLIDLCNVLYKTIFKDERVIPGLRSSYCHATLKRMWYFDPKQSSAVFDKTVDDEYQNKWDYYIRKINSYNKIEEKGNIENE